MISDLILKLQEKTDLTYDEMNNIMTDVLSGKTSDSQNMDFLSRLSEKGETDDEFLIYRWTRTARTCSSVG